MKSDKLRFWLIIILTLATSGMVNWASRISPIENKMFFKFPLVVGEWTGHEIPMSDYVYQGIETPYLFLRDYSQSGIDTKVNLAIVWFDDTNIAFHTPEACLGGVGEQVIEKKNMSIVLDKKHEITKDIVNLNGTRQIVLYFFDVDGYITTSQPAVRIEVLKRRLLFKRTSASFIRIMAPIGTNEKVTMELLVDFLKAIYPVIPDYTYTDKISRGIRSS